jgi:hypothetical protein
MGEHYGLRRWAETKLDYSLIDTEINGPLAFAVYFEAI